MQGIDKKPIKQSTVAVCMALSTGLFQNTFIYCKAVFSIIRKKSFYLWLEKYIHFYLNL